MVCYCRYCCIVVVVLSCCVRLGVGGVLWFVIGGVRGGCDYAG